MCGRAQAENHNKNLGGHVYDLNHVLNAHAKTASLVIARLCRRVWGYGSSVSTRLSRVLSRSPPALTVGHNHACLERMRLDNHAVVDADWALVHVQVHAHPMASALTDYFWRGKNVCWIHNCRTDPSPSPP